MRLSHTVGRMSALFDEPNLIGSAGLVPAVALADRIGLAELVDRVLTVPGAKGCAGVKVTSVLAGMLAGADSIDDLDVLRHGAMGKLFGGVRAPSTLGTFLRSFRFGHVRQLDAVASRAVGLLAGRVPMSALLVEKHKHRGPDGKNATVSMARAAASFSASQFPTHLPDVS